MPQSIVGKRARLLLVPEQAEGAKADLNVHCIGFQTAANAPIEFEIGVRMDLSCRFAT
jgi:hypothetical protein